MCTEKFKNCEKLLLAGLKTVKQKEQFFFSDLGNTAGTASTAGTAGTAPEPEPEMRRGTSLTVVAYTNSLKLLLPIGRPRDPSGGKGGLSGQACS